MAQDPQTYQLEIRFAFHGTFQEAEHEALRIIQASGNDFAEFTGMFDSDWNEV